MKLYEVTDDFLAALEAAYEAADDQTGEVSHEMVERIQAAQVALDDKLESCCKVIKNLEAAAGACEAEAKRLTAQKKTAEANVEWLRDYIKLQLERAGISERRVGVFKLSVQASPPPLFLTESELAPEHWMQPPKVPDKEGIRAALKAGVPVAGAELISGTHLRIR